ncbi:hypothetical protein ANCCEY_02060 [Ancylostoma ceylanicum]|uniref:WD domain, G-beta repeat protein n=1 Tax=Ancylostoma ceylanicum TaxID=53326 RepID=A0A0D6M5X6_9BILA|nr:hypothetical protein ANCCEY_02060 [Ancylostoma ceylanicum]
MEVEKRRDVRIEGKTVHSMAIHEGMGKLVVSRKNGANSSDDVIEQYNVLCGWLCVHEKVICPDNGGIESVCFVGDRILCTHLNGSVTIADPHSDSIRRVQICPSPLWSSCAIDATHAAFVSHSASLFILELNDYTVSTPLSLGIDQRLFSVCSQKDVISIGAMDSVFIVKNNAVARKMVVPRKEKRLPTIVWTTCFFNETIVASGDSRGVISFWNFNNGALLASLESHQSDILCLVMCEDRLHAAGVDPRIMSIKRIAANDFRIVQKRNGPVRDVRAMARFDDKIYAAGEDHSIFVAKDGCQVLMNQWNKLLTFGGPLVMSRGHCFVDLWTNGTSEQSNCKGAVVVKRQPFPKNGGPSRRSASTVDLFGAPGYRAVSITPGPGDQLVVVASDGQWVLIDKTRSSVQGPIAPPSRRPSAAVPSTLHFRSRKRVCACRLQASEPTTAPFKLKNNPVAGSKKSSAAHYQKSHGYLSQRVVGTQPVCSFSGIPLTEPVAVPPRCAIGSICTLFLIGSVGSHFSATYAVLTSATMASIACPALLLIFAFNLHESLYAGSFGFLFIVNSITMTYSSIRWEYTTWWLGTVTCFLVGIAFLIDLIMDVRLQMKDPMARHSQTPVQSRFVTTQAH